MAEVEYTGWGTRLVKSIGGALIGIVLFLVAFPVLLWNEHNSVTTARSLEEGSAACVSVNSDKIDEANEGKLIHTTGEATTSETVKDDQFGVSDKALKLVRTVEIYQYEETSRPETKKKVGGGEVTITHYEHPKKWVKEPISSNGFHADDDGVIPVNVGTRPYKDDEKYAPEVKLGAFKLKKEQVDRIGKGDPRSVTAEEYAALPAEMKTKLKLKEGVLYQPYQMASATVKPGDDADKSADDLSEPQIGDVRITFLVLKPQPVSVVAKQFKGSFEPWTSKEGGKDINDIRPGTMSQEAMFAALQRENEMLTWALRLGGFVLMAFGLFLVFKPFAVFADVLPFLGDLASVGVALFAILVALPLSLVTIALSWVVVRPLIGVPLLVVGVGLIGAAIFLVWKSRSAKALAKQQG